MSLGPSGDTAKQGRQAKLENDADKRTDMAIAEVMSSAQGRRCLWALINSSGVFGYSGHGDGLEHRSGRRDYGVFLIDWLQRVAPERYLLMLQEAAMEASETKALAREVERDEGETTDVR